MKKSRVDSRVRLSRESLRPALDLSLGCLLRPEAPYYNFKTAVPTFLSLFMAYGTFQNNQCHLAMPFSMALTNSVEVEI